MRPVNKQLRETVSDNMRVLWTGTVGVDRVRITRDLRFDLRSGGGIEVHIEGDDPGEWWLADGGVIRPNELIAGLMEAGKLKF